VRSTYEVEWTRTTTFISIFIVLVKINLSSHRQISVLSVMGTRQEISFLILSINVA